MVQDVGQVQMHDGEQQLLYKTSGTCSQFIEVAVKDGKVSSCKFHGGCSGNTQGLSQLVIGMNTKDVIERLNGIRCGAKCTSCPDQLCRALEQFENK
jgi:uncharacterized protein (TIGR03905 family)